LVVVYIFRRDRSDALRLGSHGDGRADYQMGPRITFLRYFPSRWRKGIPVEEKDIGLSIEDEDEDSGWFSFMTLSNSLCLLLHAFLFG
jgi:hypothetical protein